MRQKAHAALNLMKILNNAKGHSYRLFISLTMSADNVLIVQWKGLKTTTDSQNISKSLSVVDGDWASKSYQGLT